MLSDLCPDSLHLEECQRCPYRFTEPCANLGYTNYLSALLTTHDVADAS
jgi:hypothetical protein